MAERGIRIAETGVRFSLGPPRGENFSAGRIADLPAIALAKAGTRVRLAP